VNAFYEDRIMRRFCLAQKVLSGRASRMGGLALGDGAAGCSPEPCHIRAPHSFTSLRIRARTVDRGYGGSHRTQIGGKLPPMVDGVFEHERQRGVCGQLPLLPERDGPGQQLARERFHLVDLGRNLRFLPSHNILGGMNRAWKLWMFGRRRSQVNRFEEVPF